MPFPRQLLPLTLLACAPVLACADSDPFHWLLGCWEDPASGSREVWVRQSDNEWLGMNATLAGGRIVFHEVLAIHRDAAGYHYTAHPEGQPAATFSAAAPRDGAVAFTKPDHDYPQRIRYERSGATLHATIELLDGSRPNRFDKVRCADG